VDTKKNVVVFLDQVQKLRDDLKRKTGEVQEAKDKLPFRTIPEMENRVRELESRIESGQLTLTEEKQTVAEISKLNKARKAFENLDGNSSDAGTMRLRIDAISAKVSEKDEIIKGIRAKLDELNAKFDALNGVKADEESKKKERQAAYEKAKKDLDQAYTQKREAYEEYRKAKQAAAEARIKRDARRAEFDRRRQIEDEIEELEEKLLAFNPETTADKKINECNNLKNFFMELIKEDGVSQETCDGVSKIESGVRQVKLSNELAGAEVIVKDRDEYFFAPKPKKGSKQQSSAAPNLSVSLAKLPLHILSGLADLRLPIPTNRSDIDQLFTEMDKKKTEFSGKQDSASAEKELQRKALQDQIDQLKKKLEDKPKKDEPAAEK